MISRRVFTALLAGIPAGVIGGSFLRRWTTPGASIRFIGQRDTLLALLDTGEERVLFLLGEPDTRVLEHLPQLLTVGNIRIDLVVGSHRWLTSDGFRSAIDLESIATLSLQGDTSLAPISGNVTPVTSVRSIRLGSETTVTLSVDQQFGDDPNDPHMLVEIWIDETRIALANTVASFTMLTDPIHLLAAPGEVSVEAIEQVSPSVFVGTALHEPRQFEELLTYYNEPIALVINNGQLEVEKR